MLQTLLGTALLAVSVSAQVLTDFQVTNPPPATKYYTEACTVFLVEHTFGNSYYSPAVVNYTPPTNCGPAGSWAGVTLNFTVTSNGTQYDRLGVFSFQDVEIWRTSTPEPTADGIIWTYIKDVTKYTPLFAKEGTMLIELDNELDPDDGLTGQYAATLTATFYASSIFYPTAGQANLIVPISTYSPTQGEPDSVPPILSDNVTLPQNTVQVYAEIFASGNGEEEFWYYSVPNEFLGDLPDGFAYGDGPFREVRLLVDGQLAGVAFPYAVIFTGGINYACWAPITSYGALEQPTYVLDLTPFVPILADGQSHNISIDVSSAETDHAINDNWYISGNLQVVTGSSSRPTTGKITYYNADPYATTTSTASYDNPNINITVKATHTVKIEAEVISGDGEINYVVFEQNLSYENVQTVANDYNIQNVVQTSSGSVISTHNGIQVVVDNFEYPLTIDITEYSDYSVYTYFDHAYYRELLPAPFLLGSTINNHQIAGGYIGSYYGDSINNNTYSYIDLKGDTYFATIDQAYNVLVTNDQSGTLASTYLPSWSWFTYNLEMAIARMPGGNRFSFIQF